MISNLSKLEYAIYHWNYQKEISLPGLKNGLPQLSFFSNLFTSPIRKDFEEQITDLLQKKILGWVGFSEPSLILCSGGVDSSLLVTGASNSNAKFQILHTAYTNHDNNDLEKLNGILQKFSVYAHVFSLGSEQYSSGLRSMWRKQYFQNTYAPTLAYVFDQITPENKIQQLITGSGPDELFYGMEKYSWDFFNKLSKFDVTTSLEKIDVAYNMSAYCDILSPSGLLLLEEIRENRRVLYGEIAKICSNIFDAQRLLAYCTVTAQHMHLFDGLSAHYGLQHFAPYLDEELIRLAFSIPTELLIHNPQGETSVEIGKYHLKKFLARHMNKKHVFSKKIGFHAPTTRFMYSNALKAEFNKINWDELPNFLDPKRTKLLVDKRLSVENFDDYFLYSILNLVHMS